MELEMISRRPSGAAKGRPLLFVHGSNSGAWVWDVHFMPYLAERGYASHALSLRGHGRSQGGHQLPFTRIAHYVEDVTQAVEKIGVEPILVGHSMGASVIQRYFQHHRASGAVFMAPVPLSGLAGASLGLFRRDSSLFWQMAMVQSGAVWMATPGTLRRALFSDRLDSSVVRDYFKKPQAESPVAVMELMGAGLPGRRHAAGVRASGVPVLVMGAEDDAFFPPPLVRETASALGVQARFFSDMAHAMMLEPDWKDVADHLIQWLDTHYPKSGSCHAVV